jgi:D-alanyl-D-alanine dipeptidase
MIKKIILLVAISAQAYALPNDFVYLKSIDPSILQDIRYAGYHNFIGRPIKGYEAPECILTKQAALALHNVQTELKKHNLSLKVYDCYRPQMAVNDFIAWSQLPQEQSMKAEFYPRIEKMNAFKLGYIAKKSGHSRGSTIDLTIVSPPAKKQGSYHRGQSLVSCFSPYEKRFQDNSIDMGTGYDCLDRSAHGNYQNINSVALKNRQLLRTVMEKNNFEPYAQEWWHFTLKNEAFPHTFFNFPITIRG